jgi:transposase
MAEVMIGIDPHKSSHTAVAISAGEEPLGELQVHACPSQVQQLLAWAAAWPERTWAVEGAAGLGHLLAQQLVAAGEQVLDVPPKLAARVRLLQAGDTNKNDPNDAFSVAVAALRSPAKRPVLAEDHAAVLKVWAKRHRYLLSEWLIAVSELAPRSGSSGTGDLRWLRWVKRRWRCSSLADCEPFRFGRRSREQAVTSAGRRCKPGDSGFSGGPRCCWAGCWVPANGQGA